MKTQGRGSRSRLGISHAVFAALVASGLASQAHAGDTWTGGGASGNWSDSTNWGGAQPGYGTLTFTGSTRITNTADQSYSDNELLWTGTSSWTTGQANSATISLFDNGGAQAKIENQSSGLVTLNVPITFAATTGNAWGEINAVNGGLTFGTGTLSVTGSAVNGIRLFGSGQATTFNNTVSATGKYFDTSGTGDVVNIGGSFTSGDIDLMNAGVLNYTAGTISTSALRLGGDYATSGSQNLTLGATFNLTSTTGGQSFDNVINPVANNTSGALQINAQNTSGTDTLKGSIYLDSSLAVSTASLAGGSLLIGSGTSTSSVVSFQSAGSRVLTVGGAGATTINDAFANVLDGTDRLIVNGPGSVTLTRDNSAATANLLLFNVAGGTLAISAANNLGSPVVSGNGYPDKVLFGSATGVSTSTLQINGTFAYGSTAAGSLLGFAINKTSSASGANTAAIDVTGSNVFTMNGAISDNGTASTPGSLRKTDTGTLVLTAASSFTGGTNVSGGSLYADNATGSATGTGSVSVSPNGTLGGSGTVSGPVYVTGTITAGPAAGVIGTLRTGQQTWNTGSIYTAKLGTAGTPTSPNATAVSDELIMSGMAPSGTIGLQLSNPSNAAYTTNEKWVIADFLGLTTTTFNLSQFVLTPPTGVSSSHFTLSQQLETGTNAGDDVIVTYDATPEPTSAVLLGLAFTPLIARRRRGLPC